MTDTPESIEALADGLCSLSGVIIDTVMDGEERPFGLRLSPVEATGLSSEAAAALRRYAALLAAPRAEAAVVAARQEAEERFAAWFRKNYPGPDTIICKPDWHAPKIFRAVLAALAPTP